MDAALFPFLTVQLGGPTLHHWHTGDAIRNLTAPTNRVWIIESGELRVRLAGATFILGAGDALLLPAKATRNVSTAGEVRWLSGEFRALVNGALDLVDASLAAPLLLPSPESGPTLYASLVQAYLATVPGGSSWRPYGEWDARISPRLGSRIPRLPPEDLAALLLNTALAQALFASFWSRTQSRAHGSNATPGLPYDAIVFDATRQQGVPRWLVGVLETVPRDPAQSLDAIAAAAGVSEVQLRRGFARHFGIPPSRYLLHVRLDAARRLLETTERSVIEIARTVGFDSQSYFTRRYKERFGHTPARNRHPAL